MWLSGARSEALARRRRFMAGPVGCGLCGIDSLGEALRPLPPVTAAGPVLGHAEMERAMAGAGDWQPLHDQTGAVHAAALLSSPARASSPPARTSGRHNALDKLIGALARAGHRRRGRGGRADQPGLGGDGAEERPRRSAGPGRGVGADGACGPPRQGRRA